MSAGDFLLAPEIQKLLQVLATPREHFLVAALAKKTELEADVTVRALDHLVGCGMLTRSTADDAAGEMVSLNTAFVFYPELRSIALKSFAAAEPLCAMLRSKFTHAVLRAFGPGEDADATVELLVVHGQEVPDAVQMAAACRRLSASNRRHLNVHVISHARHAFLTAENALGARLPAPSAFEIIRQGATKARLPPDREGLLRNAKKKLSALRW